MKKSQLPHKVCPVCGFSFNWRKKWASQWEQIVYCSERCRRNKRSKVLNVDG
ncbi:DUF2256 domain-containing protein [Veronia pacifica]|uniref:DUF2256 domain-containing protein n=1 Tax=Veronia pacifica TaxID=1080227 RepID=UPI0009F20529|nr:DUF2256 domain-containing protein [Veronia pacifica]